MKFQYELEALGRYVEVLDNSLRRFAAQEKMAFKRKDYLEGMPDGWSGEAQMVAEEELSKVEEVMPRFAFGSTLALCFMLLEQLLQDLVKTTEMRKGGQTFKRFPHKRGEPAIKIAHRFLAESWNVSLELDEETAQELDRLRVMRNQFIHAVSMEVYPGTISEPVVSVTREDVDAALMTIGAYAFVLECGLQDSR